MARPRTPPPPIHLRSARLLDIEMGELVEPGELLVDGERIVEVAPPSVPDDAVVMDLGDLTLLPGLMDMEVNLLLGGPDSMSPLNAVQDGLMHALKVPWPPGGGQPGVAVSDDRILLWYGDEADPEIRLEPIEISELEEGARDV